MPANINAYQLPWNFAFADSVEQSQRWILRAMSSHGPAMVTMLWRILGNEQDVCDAYQQTFLNLAHNNLIKKPNNVKAYLFRTASNIAISMIRQQRYQKKSKEVIASTLAETDDRDYTVDLDSRLMQERLREAISQLPDYLKEVVVLRDLGELPYNQIAKIMGVSASSARAYRSKAITLLASWMSRQSKQVLK